jgi:hypothetical protein
MSSPVVIVKKKKKTGKGRPKMTLGSLNKRVNHLTSTLEGKFMMSFANPSDHKHAGIVETTTKFCEDMTQYTREDEQGVISAPGFTLKQRGVVDDDYEHDKEGGAGRTYLNKVLKMEGEPRFDGPVTSPGNSSALKDACTYKYVVNSELGKYDTHALPIELVCEQTKFNTVHMKEVVDPALESARKEIAILTKDNSELKRKFDAMTQVVESLVEHSVRSNAIQIALMEHGDIELEESPPAVTLVGFQDVLEQGIPELNNDSAPVPLLAKLPIAKQIGFQGALDEKETVPTDKTKYWRFGANTIQSLGTKWSRQENEEEEEDEDEEIAPPSPKKTKVVVENHFVELNIEAPPPPPLDSDGVMFDPFGLNSSMDFNLNNSFDLDCMFSN